MGVSLFRVIYVFSGLLNSVGNVIAVFMRRYNVPTCRVFLFIYWEKYLQCLYHSTTFLWVRTEFQYCSYFWVISDIAVWLEMLISTMKSNLQKKLKLKKVTWDLQKYVHFSELVISQKLIVAFKYFLSIKVVAVM